MALSARTASDPRYVAQKLSPRMRRRIRGAQWYKATYFATGRPGGGHLSTSMALSRRGLHRWDEALDMMVLTPFGEQVRRVLKQIDEES